jgi:hypothetical protein
VNAVIAAEVQGVPGDDRCVILCGYPTEMKNYILNANPGIQRRFQYDNSFVFEDYSSEDLGKILLSVAKSKGLKITAEAKAAALSVLEKKRMKPNFGNGGDVVTLLTQAIESSQKRALLSKGASSSSVTLIPEDFDSNLKDSPASLNPASLFDDLINCDGVKKQISEIQAIIEDAHSDNRNPLDVIGLNFKFVGPPGNGRFSPTSALEHHHYNYVNPPT